MESWQFAVEAAQARKAEDIVVLRIGEVSSLAEYFVVCSGTNTRQTQAIADAIEDRLREEGWRPMGVEGKQVGEWILMDYGDLVVHIFSPQKRKFFDLERLWRNAPQVPVPEAA
jgi:ribosome-associated protein